MHAATLRNWAMVALVLVSSALPARRRRAARRQDARQGRFRAARHGPVRPARAATPAPATARSRARAASACRCSATTRTRTTPPSPATTSAGASTPSTPTAACCCSRRPARSRTAAACASRKDSWQYQRLPRVDRAGGARGRTGSGDGQGRSRITPAELAFKQGRRDRPAQGHGHASPTAPRTTSPPFCDFRTNDDAVAEVTNLGAVKALRPGDTAVVVTYRGNVLPVRVLVPMALPAGFAYPEGRPRSTTSTARSSPSCGC